MRDALLVGSLVAAMCAVLSCFLILRGWSLMGDAISHAVLPGIVIAYIIGWPLAVGAFIAGLFCAVSTGFIQHNSRLKEDTVMGVVFTGLFAFGLVLFSMVPSDLHLNHILFGNILGIGPSEWREIIVVSVVVLLLCSCLDVLIGNAAVIAAAIAVVAVTVVGVVALAFAAVHVVGVVSSLSSSPP